MLLIHALLGSWTLPPGRCAVKPILDSTVGHLGIEIEHARAVAEQIDV
jgi:hypothetical protein